jgi:hypothetical protein
MIQNIRSSVFSVVGSHALLIFLVVFFPLLGTLQATQEPQMAVIPSGYLCTQQPGWASALVGEGPPSTSLAFKNWCYSLLIAPFWDVSGI